MDHNRDIGIAAHGMEEMIAALTIAIPFTGNHNGRQARVGRMDAQCRRKCPAVQSVEKIAFQIMRELGGLADARYINGDYLDKTAEWRDGNTDVSSLAGQPIRLRFDCRGAKLYSFCFAN